MGAVQPSEGEEGSRGVAPRYYGPFMVVGKYTNKCDYLIRECNKPGARVKQIHQNNLRVYFRRGHPDDAGAARDQEGEDIATQPQPKRRTYIKDMNNPRWSRQRQTANASHKNIASSSETGDEGSDESSSSEDEQAHPQSETRDPSPPVEVTDDNREQLESSTDAPIERTHANHNTQDEIAQLQKELWHTGRLRPTTARYPSDRNAKVTAPDQQQSTPARLTVKRTRGRPKRQ